MSGFNFLFPLLYWLVKCLTVFPLFILAILGGASILILFTTAVLLLRVLATFVSFDVTVILEILGWSLMGDNNNGGGCVIWDSIIVTSGTSCSISLSESGALNCGFQGKGGVKRKMLGVKYYIF